MTTLRADRAAAQSARGAARDALRWTTALAIGAVSSEEDLTRLEEAARRLGWSCISSATARERCFGPSWMRSGAVLRRAANAETVTEWRKAVARLDDIGRMQVAALGHALEALRPAGVQVVVLKGAALSMRAYGAPFLRDSSDLDLFVPARQRVPAHLALCDAGWRHVDGSAPGEASYISETDETRAFIEMHSSLADDPLVSHVRLPEPGWDEIDIEGVRIPAHAGPTLAPYLAVHLAKHTSAPLLWVLDFAALWSACGDADRRRARRIASAAGAQGYLDLAIRRAAALHRAADGERRAQRRCGGASGLYRERHAAVVGALAAPTPFMGAKVFVRWMARRFRSLGLSSPWPATSRLAWLDRLVRRFRRASSDRGEAAGGQPVRSRVVQLDIESSLDLIRALLRQGTPVWLAARGGSMAPTIRSGAHILLTPRTAGQPVRRGEIVFATPPTGTPVVHRVRATTGHLVTLRGDAMDCDDAPVPLSAILARVTHISDHGRCRALGVRAVAGVRATVQRALSFVRSP